MRKERNELNKHKKSDAVKWVLVFVAIILLAVSVAAAITQGFTTANPWGWLDKSISKTTSSKQFIENEVTASPTSVATFESEQIMQFGSSYTYALPSELEACGIRFSTDYTPDLYRKRVTIVENQELNISITVVVKMFESNDVFFYYGQSPSGSYFSYVIVRKDVDFLNPNGSRFKRVRLQMNDVDYGWKTGTITDEEDVQNFYSCPNFVVFTCPSELFFNGVTGIESVLLSFEYEERDEVLQTRYEKFYALPDEIKRCGLSGIVNKYNINSPMVIFDSYGNKIDFSYSDPNCDLDLHPYIVDSSDGFFVFFPKMIKTSDYPDNIVSSISLKSEGFDVSLYNDICPRFYVFRVGNSISEYLFLHDTGDLYNTDQVRVFDPTCTLSEPEYLPLPEDPVKEGYDFDGWYYGTEEEHSSRCVKYVGQAITAETKLHAHFIIKRVKVQFNDENGMEVDYYTLSWNESLPGLMMPTKKGYNFLGWYYADGTRYTGQAIKADTVLSMRWEKQTFKVTFYVENTVYAEKTVEFGTIFTDVLKTASIPTRAVKALKMPYDADVQSLDKLEVTEDISVQIDQPTESEQAVEFFKNNKKSVIIGVAGLVVLIVLISVIVGTVTRRRRRRK